jgi:hypothetical protein
VELSSVDPLPEDPWVVQIVLTTLNQENGEVPVEVGKTACHNTSCRTTCML